MKKILITANSSFALWNFRGKLIKLISKKYDLHIAVPLLEGDLAQESHFPTSKIYMKNTNKGIISNLISFASCFYVVLKQKPDLILSFTIKNNVFFGIISRLLGIKFIPNVTGVGSYQEDLNFFQLLILKPLYRFSMRGANHIFFQNSFDRDFFIKSNFTEPQKNSILPGSGIDLSVFEFVQKDYVNAKQFIFLFASRLLKEKGIESFINAAIRINNNHSNNNVRFIVCGEHDKNDSRYVDASIMKKIKSIKNIEYVGKISDVKTLIADSSCVVLPSSYNEGVPRILIESLAIGRPIITTNRPGCKVTLKVGETGYFTKEYDEVDLSNTMIKIMNKDPAELEIMSNSCRELAEKSFSDEIIISEYLAKI